MKKNKQNYVAPGLTVVEFKVERGYAESSINPWSAAQQIQTFVDNEMIVSQNLTEDGQLVAGYLDHQDYSDPTQGSSWAFENGTYF